MKKEKLITELQKLPDGVEVCIFDWKSNMKADSGDGSSVGIYPEFHVTYMTGKDIPCGVLPFAVLDFDNGEED